MIKCPECGQEVGNSKFCSNCGTKLDNIKFCPNCSAPVDEGSAFCSQCGRQIAINNMENIVCPYCSSKIDDLNSKFCPECGKKFKTDPQSLDGIKMTIKYKKLAVLSIISIIFAVVICLALSCLFGFIGLEAYFSLAIFIALFLVIGFFASFFNDIINSGLLGIIVGLVIGLISGSLVEMVGGFSFSYELLFGYASIIYTVFGFIVGLVSTKYLRNYISKYIDVDNTF